MPAARFFLPIFSFFAIGVDSLSARECSTLELTGISASEKILVFECSGPDDPSGLPYHWFYFIEADSNRQVTPPIEISGSPLSANHIEEVFAKRKAKAAKQQLEKLINEMNIEERAAFQVVTPESPGVIFFHQNRKNWRIELTDFLTLSNREKSRKLKTDGWQAVSQKKYLLEKLYLFDSSFAILLKNEHPGDTRSGNFVLLFYSLSL